MDSGQHYYVIKEHVHAILGAAVPLIISFGHMLTKKSSEGDQMLSKMADKPLQIIMTKRWIIDKQANEKIEVTATKSLEDVDY